MGKAPILVKLILSPDRFSCNILKILQVTQRQITLRKKSTSKHPNKQKRLNNNNNRFIISTIGPKTRHSLLVTIGFSRLLSAFDVLYSTNFACLELQKLHTFFHNFLSLYTFPAVLFSCHGFFLVMGTIS